VWCDVDKKRKQLLSFIDPLLSFLFLSASVGCPGWVVVVIVDDEVSVILHGQAVGTVTLSSGVGSPSGVVVMVVDDEISVILHHQAIRSMALSSGVASPNSVAFSFEKKKNQLKCTQL